MVAAAGTASTGGYGTYQMTAAGTWTYTLNNSNSTVQALQTGAHLADTFKVTTAEGTQQLISIDITGANDAAVISGTASGSVTEAGGVNNTTPGTATASGTLTDIDVDNPANIFTAVAAGAATTNGYGTFQMTAAGTWTYTLNDNNATVQALNASSAPLTDTFTVTTIDGTAQLVTVTIHGANDAAVISGTASGSVTEAGGVNNTTPGTATASGTLTDTDVDNPANTFTAVAAGAATTNGYGTFQMTAAGTWTYTLNDNNAAVQALNASSAPLTDSFTVTTVDGTAQTGDRHHPWRQRYAGDYGGVAGGVRGRYGPVHAGQHRHHRSRQFKLFVHGYEPQPRHLPDHNGWHQLGQRRHVHDL